MKIVGSLTSPFVRIVRVVCEELNIPHELEITGPFKKPDEAKQKLINDHNPLMKVPVLIDGDKDILDSRIIVSYLLQRDGGKSDFGRGFPAGFEDENILTVILGATDAGILRFMVKAAQPDMDMNVGYMARSVTRMEHAFGWLDKQAALGRDFGVNEVALICGLEWLQKRKIYEWQGFANIVKIHQTYCDRPSLVKTRIPESA